jgi:hypothetical protein
MSKKGRIMNDGSGDYYFVPLELCQQEDFRSLEEYLSVNDYEMPEEVIYVGGYPDDAVVILADD